jgi:hypothetical protein
MSYTRELVVLTMLSSIIQVALGSCSDANVRREVNSGRQSASLAVEPPIHLGTLFTSLDFESTRDVGGLQTSSASLDRAYEVVISDITWLVAVRGDSEKVVFLSTVDQRFLTAEGIRVGSRMSEALEASHSGPVNERGFASWVRLPSGWCAATHAFATGDGSLVADSMGTAAVSFLFKRE